MAVSIAVAVYIPAFVGVAVPIAIGLAIAIMAVIGRGAIGGVSIGAVPVFIVAVIFFSFMEIANNQTAIDFGKQDRGNHYLDVGIVALFGGFGERQHCVQGAHTVIVVIENDVLCSHAVMLLVVIACAAGCKP
jgi:hypothetical protein